MSREEVEKRLEQLMGSITAIDPDKLSDGVAPGEQVDEADSLEELENEDLQTASPKGSSNGVISD
jgi:hypothetical protein